jgi:hypothetical protein
VRELRHTRALTAVDVSYFVARLTHDTTVDSPVRAV